MTASLIAGCLWGSLSETPKEVSAEVMQQVFQEISTPYKYGVVFRHEDSTKMIDSPTIFRKDNTWYMSYIVFDGQGYETWMAQSENLLEWVSLGRIMSFTENTWDSNQKAGYMALIDIKWGGSYEVEKFDNRYWMSYLGGATTGYEAGKLAVGMAFTEDLLSLQEWTRMEIPVLSPDDAEVRWFENKKIFKSSIIRDSEERTGFPFLMYYNALGDTADYESIALAASHDMQQWERIGTKPLITRYKGICGDAQIVKMDDIYVMFYFGAFWKDGAFERFACSYDLMHWTDWKGEDLISPGEDYDAVYAHKPWVIYWEGVVYHFYNAVGSQGRVIALATSKNLKKWEEVKH
ncbi:MAG: glycosylase [Cyclobacteriaceae bacterium]|nr:glycosylase [Cyclobacteriaceae bacterium]